jgi:hypothetical protein
VEAYILLHKNTAALVTASKDIDLEVNAGKTKNMVMFQDQQAGQNHNIKTGNKSFQWVEQFRYLGKPLKNQNSIHEKIKSRVKSGNACYHLVQNLLSCLLLKNRKMKICRNVILPEFCMVPHLMEDIPWCLCYIQRQNVYYLLNTTTFLYLDRYTLQSLPTIIGASIQYFKAR